MVKRNLFSLLPFVLLFIISLPLISGTSFQMDAQVQNQAEKQPEKEKKSEKELSGDKPEIYTGDRFIYAYSANQTEIGATGLFTVFDANTLRRREFRIGFAATRFHRDPGLRITQFPISGTYAVRDWLEVFGSFNPHQRVGINSPDKTSGALLSSSLNTNGISSNNLLSNVNQGFFLLPGLPVSGALVGGVLPGLPIGQARSVFDPILNRQKNAFTTPRYFNDLPFAGQRGSSTGDLLFGAKLRTPFLKLTADFNNKRVTISQASVLGYVKVSSHGAGNLLSNPNSALFRGGGSGTTDFGVFLLKSFYVPNCLLDEFFGGKNKCELKPEEIIKTTNVHTNFGFVRNGDPKAGGMKLIDRKDAFIFGLGMDTILNRYAQALVEAKVTRYIGGGTPNMRGNSPVDVTAGFRAFPLGLPKIGLLKQSRFFFSVGGGYRYSFDVSGLSGLARSNHGFIFQLSFGRSNKSSADTSEKIPSKVCKSALEVFKENPLAITELTTDKDIVQKGAEIRLRGQVANGDDSFTIYEVKLSDGRVVDRFSGSIVEDEKFERIIKVDFNAGNNYTFFVTAKFIKGGETCTETSKTSNPFSVVMSGEMTLNLTPPSVGPISARKTQDVTFRASVQNADPTRLTRAWRISPDVPLTCGNNEVCNVNSASLQPGGRYTVTVAASDNSQTKQDQAQIIVNNPPTVSLRLSQIEIKRGAPLVLTANGNDVDGDKLTYTWSVSSHEGQVVKTWQGAESELTLDTTPLKEGDLYSVSVTVSDNLDEVTSEPANFSIDLPGPQVFFEFDRDRINVPRKTLPRGESANKLKLAEVANRLKQQSDLTLFIRVEGNADIIGKVHYNECLGCRRACAVRQELLRQGVKESQIRIIVSYGKTKAIGGVRDYEQRKRDRRVDLIFSREGESLDRGGVECNCQKTPPRSKCRQQ